MTPRRVLLACLALVLATLCTAPAMAADARPTVRVLTLSADIDPVTAHWVVEQIHAAASAHDSAVVLQLDTPGGLSTSMDDIRKAELASPVPVIVYVWPPGGRAASAGFYIMQSADVAAMVPDSNAGSATPISGTGGNIGSDLRRKIIADAATKIAADARTHGRNAAAAVATIVPHPRPGCSGSGCTLVVANYTAAEAYRLHVIDVPPAHASTLDALLRTIDGTRGHYRYKPVVLHTANAQLDHHGLPLSDRLLDILLDPNLISLLFLLGIGGIAFEVTHPGIVLPGLLGGVSLMLGLFGLSIIPFSWTGVALALFGLALLALETHVPTHGAFAAVGTLSLAIGLLMLFRVDGSPYGTTSVWLVVSIVLALAAFFMLVLQRVIAARHLPVATGTSGLLGERAIVATPLAPEGRVFVRGERWNAIADGGGAARPGDEVVVTGVEELRLHVAAKPAPSGTEPSSEERA